MKLYLLLGLLVPAALWAGGEEWARYKASDRIEVSPACSDSWWPATILRVEADAVNGAKYRKYTVKRDDGHEWSFSAPGYVAPCVRAIGTLAKERALLPAPLLGTYNCNYRGQIAPGSDFALLDGTTYRDYDGNQGSYRFDTGAKVLVFVTGPKKGYRAQQETAKTFQILDLDGSATGNFCPHNPGRDPRGKRL
jgi:hypothetical protein